MLASRGEGMEEKSFTGSAPILQRFKFFNSVQQKTIDPPGKKRGLPKTKTLKWFHSAEALSIFCWLILMCRGPHRSPLAIYL